MANIIEFEGPWISKMGEFEERRTISTIPSNPSANKLAEDLNTFKDLICKELGLLRQQIQECNRVVDAMDMRQRHKIMLIKGIPKDSEVDVQTIVSKLIQDKLGLKHISKSSFKRCHRVGLSFNGVRAILVHFHDPHTMSEVWKAKSKLKGTGYTIMEFLTGFQYSVQTRAQNHFGIKRVSTSYGAVYVEVPGGGREKVCSEEELDFLIHRYQKQSFAIGSTLETDKSNQVEGTSETAESCGTKVFGKTATNKHSI